MLFLVKCEIRVSLGGKQKNHFVQGEPSSEANMHFVVRLFHSSKPFTVINQYSNGLRMTVKKDDWKKLLPLSHTHKFMHIHKYSAKKHYKKISKEVEERSYEKKLHLSSAFKVKWYAVLHPYTYVSQRKKIENIKRGTFCFLLFSFFLGRFIAVLIICWWWG